MSSDSDEIVSREALVQIEKLEQLFLKDKKSLSTIISLSNLYIISNKKSKAQICLTNGINLFNENQLDIKGGYEIAKLSINLWQLDRYSKKDSLRINISSERFLLLAHIRDILSNIGKLKDPDFHDIGYGAIYNIFFLN